MRKLLLTLFATLALTGMAQAQSSLYVYLNDGADETVVSLADIEKITFEGANMVITPKTGSQLQVPLTTIQDFRFTPQSTTGFLQMKADAVAGPAINVRQGIVSVDGWDSSRTATLSVYAVGGQQLMSIPGWNGQNVDINNLPKGVYVIKIENKTTKIRK